VLDLFARRKVKSLDDLESAVEDALKNIVTPNIEPKLAEPPGVGLPRLFLSSRRRTSSGN
jgi:hypothetical protein